MDHEYCATIPSIFRKGGGDAGGGASEDEENPPTAGPSSTIGNRYQLFEVKYLEKNRMFE